jgi:hypothetical protein
VGLNPYKKHKRSTADYVFVVAAFVVAIACVLWVLVR